MSDWKLDNDVLINALFSICDFARLGMSVSKLHDCNDCSKQRSCEYVPEAGQTVRINCPLWKGGSDGD